MARRWPLPFLVLVLLTALFGWSSGAAARDLDVVVPVAKCEQLQGTIFLIGDDPVRITSAKVNADNAASPFCDVAGYVAPQVRFGIKLPLTAWHQRMLFLGCGGFCGTVGSRAWAVAQCGAFDRGEFAVVYSDLGHQGEHPDAVWASGNPQAIHDFGSRGVHVVTLATRRIIADFYGQPPRYAYFNGCSDGGREALMSAQRYPADFDGIVAGAPALNLTLNNSIYHAWFVQHLLAPDGKLLVDDARLAAVQAEVLRQCGTADGTIADPTRCHPDLRRLACTKDGPAPCLSHEQIAAVMAIYAGPSDPAGHRLYYGVVPGSEYGWSRVIGGSVDFAMNFTSFMTGVRRGERQNVWTIGYTPAALERFNHYAAELDALDPDLTRFRAAGGKLLVWHGTTDSSVPPGSTVDYVTAVRNRMGAAATDGFLRFYLVPGMAHCVPGVAGPTGVDFLDPMMRWVEDGSAPTTIAALGAHAWSLQPYFQQ